MNFEDISIGTDIEKIERFEKYSSDKNAPLIKRIFTEEEIEGVDYCDIEVVRNSDGVPSIKLLKEKNVDFRLSLSHGSGSAVASVIAIKK